MTEQGHQQHVFLAEVVFLEMAHEAHLGIVVVERLQFLTQFLG